MASGASSSSPHPRISWNTTEGLRKIRQRRRSGTRARSAQGFDTVTSLTGERRATLQAILEEVEGIDVLYLVCHGVLRGDVPQLFFETPDGTAELVDGRALVERLTELEHRPTVAMSCSCQSASRGDELWTGDRGELAALGPRLAAAGVAAVVAMQGNFSLDSAETFGPKSFSELRSHGPEIDRAMGAARRATSVSGPTGGSRFSSRLRSGRTYYRPAFTDNPNETWAALETALSARKLTPVMGPGLADAILSSRQEMATRWVERWQMPLAAQSRGDLAQVAQFLRVRHADGTVPGRN